MILLERSAERRRMELLLAVKKQKKLLGVLKLQLSCAEAAAGLGAVESQMLHHAAANNPNSRFD